MEKVILNDLLEADLKSIEASERMKECLELRLSLMGKNYAMKDEYEKNELSILRMKTEQQIEKLKIIIHEKKQIFEESFERYIEELEFEDEYVEQV